MVGLGGWMDGWLDEWIGEYMGIYADGQINENSEVLRIRVKFR